MSQINANNGDQLSVVRGVINSNASDAEARFGVLEGAATQTVNFTSGMSAATIQALIDAVPKNIPNGVTVTFQFANGTYSSLAGTIFFNGFYGGGTLEIFGDRTETDNSVLHTTQQVHLDLTGDATNGIVLSNNSAVNMNVFNFKITVDDGFQGINIDNSAIFGDVRYNFVVGVAKTSNNTRGIMIRNGGWCRATANFVSNVFYGLTSERGHLVSVGNDDTGTQPTNGLFSNAGNTKKSGTQPTGSSANEITSAGGVIE